VRYFLVMEKPGPTWDPARPRREQDGWGEHARFMDALADAGFVVLGGPLGDMEGDPMLVVDAASEEEARKRLAPDPWLEDGTLVIARVEPWEILLGR
jgi:uncharacterized protein YciI